MTVEHTKSKVPNKLCMIFGIDYRIDVTSSLMQGFYSGFVIIIKINYNCNTHQLNPVILLQNKQSTEKNYFIFQPLKI